jgi:hypothetical protein
MVRTRHNQLNMKEITQRKKIKNSKINRSLTSFFQERNLTGKAKVLFLKREATNRLPATTPTQ